MSFAKSFPAAAVLARYYYRHFQEELQKDSSLLEKLTVEGITFREYTEKMVADLLREFPEADTGAPFNLVRKLIENWAPVPYEKSTFKSSNKMAFSQLLDLKYATEETGRAFDEAVTASLSVGRRYGSIIRFSDVIRQDTAFRRLYHSIIDAEISDKRQAADGRAAIDSSGERYVQKSFEYYENLIRSLWEKSDQLLLNILPFQIAEELKERGEVDPVSIEDATVLFTDFVGFTRIAESMSPAQILKELNECFSYFDQIVEKFHLEKIKTIGDSYMCVSGVPYPSKTHAVDAAGAALQMNAFMTQRFKEKQEAGVPYWGVRIGVHSGPVVAGVIGKMKFSYDIWGDTVNTASRMESHGEPGRINISEATRKLIEGHFHTTPRGKISVKNKGEVMMHFLEGALS